MQRFVSVCLMLITAAAVHLPSQKLGSARSSTTEQPSIRGLHPNKALTQYVHELWHSEQGLYQSFLTAVLQTRDGYLWIGSQDGLVRFDGVRFVTFDRSNTPLKTNRITALAEDQQSTLWIGTEAGLYALRNGMISAYTTKEGLSSNAITALRVARSGTLWIATEGGGVNTYTRETFASLTTKNGLTSDMVYALTEDANGVVWAGTEGGGVNALVDGRCTAFIVDNGTLTPYKLGDALAGAPIRALLATNDGELWAGMTDGLVRFRSPLTTPKPSVQEYTTAQGLSNNDVRALLQDREGTIWIATNGGGINRALVNNGTVNFSAFTSANGLSADEVSALCEDREGSLWMATEGGGLNRFKDRRFTTYTTKAGLANNAVNCVVQDYTGAMWFGTNGGLTRFTASASNTFAATTFTTAQGLKGNVVTALHPMPDGTLWIGTRSGLQSLKGSTFTSYSAAQGLGNDLVQAMSSSPDGTLWIGTANGLYRLAHGTIEHLTASKELANANIRSLLLSRTGTLWVGTRGGGLLAYTGGTVTSYGIKDGLSSNFIWSLYEDAQGALWIATGGGLSRLSNGKFSVITKRQGLFDDAVFSVSEDENGWLWMGSNRGVFRVKKADVAAVMNGTAAAVESRSYGINDGLKSVECASGSQPALCRTNDGNLWVATTRGASVAEARSIPFNPLPPPVLIERILADGKRIGGSEVLTVVDGQTLSSSVFTANTVQTLELEPGTEKYEFHYTANSLLAPERVKFRFKLEGFDAAWVEAENRRTAYYTSLPRGKTYTFLVQACNNDGVWNTAGASVSVYLKPHFYETWWFLSLCAVAVVVLIGAAFFFRFRAIQRRNLVLKRMVEEQTAEIRKQKDILAEQASSIKQQNVELEQKNRFILAANEQMQNLLDNIESSIRYAKRIQDALLPNHDRMSHALPEYFVLYKPRDIVSGDFYWFLEHEGKIALAAADCTGHGVPGAFMSMIGHALLTEIVVEKHVLEPDKILSHLHAGIRRALKQSDGDSRDGMDIALCVIDKDAHTVEYAGAMNPLCVVRNGVLEEIKADRYSIGGMQREEERVFMKHSIEFEQDSSVMLYVFSDGYQDQFGGKEGRKFMSRRFKNLLQEIHAMPMAQQRKILDDTIEAWKGKDHRQIDDILVMGVRLK